MLPFLSTSNALRSFASHRCKVNLRQLIKCSNSNGQLRRLSFIHYPFGSRTGSSSSSSSSSSPFMGSFCNNINNSVQTRHFLGCGDGEEGVLSKIYEERRVLGYSQEQLFDVVAAVDLYHGFVPWCQRSEILKHYPDGSFDAELEIGFKFLVESYVSHVELNRPKLIKTTVSQSTLFDHLINIWEFSPGPVAGTCNLYFLVDFKFQSPLYRQIASMFFKEVASRMVGSFNERCRLIYGLEVPVLENSWRKGIKLFCISPLLGTFEFNLQLQHKLGQSQEIQAIMQKEWKIFTLNLSDESQHGGQYHFLGKNHLFALGALKISDMEAPQAWLASSL